MRLFSNLCFSICGFNSAMAVHVDRAPYTGLRFDRKLFSKCSKRQVKLIWLVQHQHKHDLIIVHASALHTSRPSHLSVPATDDVELRSHCRQFDKHYVSFRVVQSD